MAKTSNQGKYELQNFAPFGEVEARLYLAAIVDSSDDAIISKDLSGVIRTWNTGATRIFGYQPEEIIGQSVLVLIPPELHHEEPEILAKLAVGERIEHFETRRRTRDGRLIDISLTISPIRDTEGKVVGISKIARDITSRKQTEAALFESERLASVGRMAASIAHEVNNPLEAVLNLSYLIAANPSLDTEAREYARLLVAEVLRIGQITKQTLGFYRDSSQAVHVSLDDLLDAIVRLQQPILKQKSIRVHVRHQSGACVLARSAELRQVFTNLIVNAIEALPAGGELQLSTACTAKGSLACVTIADNGPGIPDHVRERIFEPFFSTKTGKGTGLGLWISQGIVRKYGGAIRCRSWAAPGRPTGTSFRVCFPNAARPA